MFAQGQMPNHPMGSSVDKVVVAIDRDGDQDEDIVLTQPACEAASGARGSGVWFDEGCRVGNRFVRVAQLKLAGCGR